MNFIWLSGLPMETTNSGGPGLRSCGEFDVAPVNSSNLLIAHFLTNKKCEIFDREKSRRTYLQGTITDYTVLNQA